MMEKVDQFPAYFEQVLHRVASLIMAGKLFQNNRNPPKHHCKKIVQSKMEMTIL